MTDPDPTPSPQADSTAVAPAGEPVVAEPVIAEPRSYAPYVLKGCGWTLLSVLLGVGVLIAGKGDFSTVGSALAGIVILLLVLSSSGLTGFWNDK